MTGLVESSFTKLLASPPHGKRYWLPVATSTAALVFLLVAAYTCKFARVTRNDQADASPFFIGIWKLEGGVAAEQGFYGNTNKCISWMDTPLYQDGGIRVAKIFSVVATFWATIFWALLLLGLCQPLHSFLRNLLQVGNCACAILALLFFCTFASEVCNEEELACQWGAGSYLSMTAAILWATTAVLSFQFTRSSNEDETNDNGSRTSRSRDLATVVTSHSTTTVPTGAQSSSRKPVKLLPPCIPEKFSDGSETSEANTTTTSKAAVDDTVAYHPHDGNYCLSRPVDLDEEVGDVQQEGAPLVSISEDDRGNLVKTTIHRIRDGCGRTTVKRSVEVVGDHDEMASV